MKKPRHLVSNPDENSMTGDCAVCGPVKLVTRQGRYRCKVAIDQQRGDRSRWPRNDRGRPSKIHPERVKLLAEQGQHCKICGDVMARPCWDHDHKTGKFRGFLCNGCNVGLGFFKDDIQRLESAVRYLKGS